MKKRILFIDDEAFILDALRRMLRSMRHEWEMEFASSGVQALELMCQRTFDLIVTDMRMPEMNGVQFLEEVRMLYPRAVRLILSGHADQELILRAVGVAHQFLAKPCDPEVLISTIVRASEMHSLLDGSTLGALVSQIGALPSRPSVAEEIARELAAAEPSLRRIGTIVADDPALSAKILQLVNSAFFGQSRSISSLVEAVTQLGVDCIRQLVLSAEAFAVFEDVAATDADLSWLWEHSVGTARIARKIAEMELTPRRIADDAFAAGLLHDIGKLVLSTKLPKPYAQVAEAGTATAIERCAAEKELFGVTHAEVGAYLLGIWGLPDGVVEAVAHHHSPTELKRTTFGPLAAVHAADTFEHRRHSEEGAPGRVAPDEEYYRALGLLHRLPAWEEAAGAIQSQSP